MISIPAIRDRVVQGALRLILEPIFEALVSRTARMGRSRDVVRMRRPRKCEWGCARADTAWSTSISSRYFDTIRHDRILAKVARRVVDGNVLAMVKQFLKSTGDRGVPQGSPLSPLLANLALNELDHALDRGGDTITYARYLDDMVVLAADTPKGRQWADRALERIRQEAEAIGVSLNMEKTRLVTITDRGSGFAFLGFEFRWERSPRTGRWYASRVPRPKQSYRNSAGSWGNPAQEPPLAYASGGGAGEPSSAGLGELLSRRQLGACVRQGQVRGRPQGEAIGGQEVQAPGIWLEAVE